MNTPETDKAERMAFSQEYMVPTEFARKLERERDEARAALADVEEYGTEEINAAFDLRRKLATALVEHDEEREKIKELIYIAERAIALAEIDFENDKFGVVTELRDALEQIKEGGK
jgi:hypothetical protein